MQLWQLIELLRKYDLNTEVAIEADSDYPRRIDGVRADTIPVPEYGGEAELPVIIITGEKRYDI